MRFGVFDPATEKRVATLTFDLANSRIAGKSERDVPDLRPALDRALRQFHPEDGVDPAQQLTGLLASAVSEFGLTVRPIAAGDITFNALWDADSGNVVGRSQVQDGVEPLPPAVLKRIGESIRSATKKPADRLAARIKALGGGVNAATEAAAALEQARAEGLFALEPSSALGGSSRFRRR